MRCSTWAHLLSRVHALESEPVRAELEIAALEDRGHDVGPVVHLKVHEVRRAVLQLVQGRELARARLDEGAVIVMKDRVHEEGRLIGLEPIWKGETERIRV